MKNRVFESPIWLNQGLIVQRIEQKFSKFLIVVRFHLRSQKLNKMQLFKLITFDIIYLIIFIWSWVETKHVDIYTAKYSDPADRILLKLISGVMLIMTTILIIYKLVII